MSLNIQKTGWEKQLLSLPGPYVDYIGLEQQAIEIDEYASQVLPGTLQITPYTQVLMGASVHTYGKTATEERMFARKKRQWAIFERENLPVLHCVVDESCLLRQIGGKEVLHEQLRHILKLIDSGRIEFQVIPFTLKTGPFVSIPGMILLRFADQPDAMWMESESAAVFLKTTIEVAQYKYTLERIHDAALTPQESRQKIVDAIELLYKNE